MNRIIKTVLFFIVATFVTACATEQTTPASAAAPCSNNAPSNVKSTFEGADVPDMETLVDQGKFDETNIDYGATWNTEFPKPEYIRIDDLILVPVGKTLTPNEAFDKLQADGYIAANPHEAMVYAAQNPDTQLTTRYFGVTSQHAKFDSSVWLSFDRTVQGGRMVSVNAMGGTLNYTIVIVAHKKPTN